MKKVSALLAALVLSVAAYAQASGGFINPANNATVSAPGASSVVNNENGTVTMKTPKGDITLKATARPGEFEVVDSTVSGVEKGFITKGTATAVVPGAVGAGYALAGLGVVLVVANTPNKGTTISGTTGSV